MSLIDVLIVAAFVIYAVSSGFRNKAQASKNLEEYFLAGRTLPGWKAGLSMAATQFAADTPLLVTGLIATAGIFALWQTLDLCPGVLAHGVRVGPQLAPGRSADRCGTGRSALWADASSGTSWDQSDIFRYHL